MFILLLQRFCEINHNILKLILKNYNFISLDYFTFPPLLSKEETRQRVDKSDGFYVLYCPEIRSCSLTGQDVFWRRIEFVFDTEGGKQTD
ncbi:hypothetical protein EAE90_03890 [Photorhabdus caribbeanensis]|nr:hypothetical protein [Photorhabdus caribbeanensis]